MLPLKVLTSFDDLCKNDIVLDVSSFSSDFSVSTSRNHLARQGVLLDSFFHVQNFVICRDQVTKCCRRWKLINSLVDFVLHFAHAIQVIKQTSQLGSLKSVNIL